MTQNSVNNSGSSLSISDSQSGSTVPISCTNSSNTASSNALVSSTVAGTSSGDAIFQAEVTGTTTWSWGIDNSVNDDWVLSEGGTLGTNNVMSVTTAGEINYGLQPAFYAFSAAGQINVTGNGTQITLQFDSELFDIGGNFDTTSFTFTAPVTGHYFFAVTLDSRSINTSNGMRVDLVTSARTYQFFSGISANVSGDETYTITTYTIMTAADTALVRFQASGGAQTVGYFGGSGSTAFQGFLHG